MTAINASSEVWLCLSGGNALGAYHAGAYRALHAAGIRPERVAGTSVGAVVGALIAGNKPEDRLARLDEFWQLTASDVAIANFAHLWDGSKIASSLGTLLHGRPRLFQPSLGLWWRRLSGLPSPSLFERSGIGRRLPGLSISTISTAETFALSSVRRMSRRGKSRFTTPLKWKSPSTI
ncbi:hypothetical protein CO657_30790 (plasmid) [Rhizobium acidisoli]|uniref:PNPLA domain-containing protein n=1 Tax=Rhizobium acidisoli TaxID=1538158 RepID=A0AAE5WTG1_9HYPH|nr:patatin-like phospholipase family protein [Rhizobium acidisoli]QAS82221.1 hypothetical protein CO657_30790 [Rhizobium acidisoli]